MIDENRVVTVHLAANGLGTGLIGQIAGVDGHALSGKLQAAI
jgi:hypothetical protein